MAIVRCPECQAANKVSVMGRRVLCTGCGEMFLPKPDAKKAEAIDELDEVLDVEEVEEIEELPEAPAARRRKPAPAAASDEDDRPRRPRRSVKSGKSGSAALTIGGIGGGILAVLAAIGLIFNLLDMVGGSWSDYSSAGGYVVAMPGKPRIEDKQVPNGTGGTTAAQIARVELRSGVYVAEHADFNHLAQFDAAQREQFFNALRGVIAQDVRGGQYVSDEPTTLAGQSGRTYHITAMGGLPVERRVILVGTRAYLLTAGSKSAKDRARFFESFRLSGNTAVATGPNPPSPNVGSVGNTALPPPVTPNPMGMPPGIPPGSTPLPPPVTPNPMGMPPGMPPGSTPLPPPVTPNPRGLPPGSTLVPPPVTPNPMGVPPGTVSPLLPGQPGMLPRPGGPNGTQQPNSEVIEAAATLPGDEDVEEIAEVKATAVDGPRTIAFSPDGNLIAGAIGNDKLRLWDPVDHKEKATFDKGAGGAGLNVVFSLDGKLLAVGNSAGEIRLFDVASLKSVGVLNDRAARLPRETAGPVTALAFTPDNKTLAEACGQQVYLYDVAQKKRRATIRHPGVVGMAISRDGAYLATGGIDRTLRLWDLKEAKITVPRALQQMPSPAMVLAFDAETTRLAAGCQDGSVRVWDLVVNREPMELRGHRSTVQGMSFSSDGKLLATCAHDRIVLWNLNAKKPLASLKQHTGGVLSVNFSPVDDTLASSGNDHSLRFWDIAKLRSQPEN